MLSLPCSILIDLLSHWLDVEDVMTLDLCCTDREARGRLLALLPSVKVSYDTCNTDVGYSFRIEVLRWLANRRMNLQDLNVKFDSFQALRRVSSSLAKNKLALRCVKSVNALFETLDDSKILMDILESFPKAKFTLSIRNLNEQSPAVFNSCAAALVSRLEHLDLFVKIYYKTLLENVAAYPMTHEFLRHFGTKVRKLRQDTGICDNKSACILAYRYCPNITEIPLGISLDNSRPFWQIARNFSKVTHVSFVYEIGVPRFLHCSSDGDRSPTTMVKSMRDVASSFSLLESVELPLDVAAQDACCFVQCCPHLTELTWGKQKWWRESSASPKVFSSKFILNFDCRSIDFCLPVARALLDFVPPVRKVVALCPYQDWEMTQGGCTEIVSFLCMHEVSSNIEELEVSDVILRYFAEKDEEALFASCAHVWKRILRLGILGAEGHRLNLPEVVKALPAMLRDFSSVQKLLLEVQCDVVDFPLYLVLNAFADLKELAVSRNLSRFYDGKSPLPEKDRAAVLDVIVRMPRRAAVWDLLDLSGAGISSQDIKEAIRRRGLLVKMAKCADDRVVGCGKFVVCL